MSQQLFPVGHFNILRPLVCCPLIEEIDMYRTQLGDEENSVDMDSQKICSRAQSLKLGSKGKRNDEILKKIGLLCPNLRCLYISSCLRISNEEIGEILKMCTELRCLRANSLGDGRCNWRQTHGQTLK